MDESLHNEIMSALAEVGVDYAQGSVIGEPRAVT